MKLSVSEHKAYGYKVVEVNSSEEIVNQTTKHKWSQGVFKDGHRNLENFVSADFIGLDIDNTGPEEITIKQAKELFEDYMHIIMPTKSHQKAKYEGGPIADRYRIILPFERTVTDPEEYYGTFHALYEKFPFLDKQCQDPCRYWEPSTSVANSHWYGKKITPTKLNRQRIAQAPVIGMKGQLAYKTVSFLLAGAPPSMWNQQLHHAALDLRTNGYTESEAVEMLKVAAREDLGNYGYLDEKDLGTIASAYKGAIFHDQRGPAKAFEFKRVGDVTKNTKKIDWLVDGLLGYGGLSLIAGPPKSGKSTIIRQLSKSIAQGIPFLGRETKKGKVLYLALEEQESLLSEQLKQLGVTDDDDFFIHTGPIIADDRNAKLEAIVDQEKPSFVVIDTMVLFVGAQDMNNYNEMYKSLTFFRDLARKSGTHINFVHHSNKSDLGGTKSIMGSSAIHGSVDNALMFSNNNGRRTITTSQRGGRPFDSQKLQFIPETQTYVLESDFL
jgi:AAA domain